LKKLSLIITAVFVLIISVLIWVYLDIQNYADNPADTEHIDHLVVVKPGQQFHSLAKGLHEKGIIKNPDKFKLFARIKGYDKNIKAGEYNLSPSMTPGDILETIVSGRIHLRKLTIPEGYSLRQIARTVAAEGFAAETEVLESATDPDLARFYGVEAETFEGYLYPETYYFPKDTTAENIISAMVKRFWLVFKSEWKEQAKTIGLSIHQVVTLASIIEKETGAGFERPLISSVFHNRLKRKMRLESDPTVIYGINDFGGNLTRKHLAEPTPYNTYKIKGLPPGPIANTGLKSIEAALYPADTQFLYFVSKKDGTHHFSTNLKDHNEAVRKYQLRK
jgi:UPF0755 protein